MNGLALLAMAFILAVIAIVSLRFQIRTWQRLRRQAVASDDRRYLRGLCQRRALNAVLLMILAGLLAGSYLFAGWEELSRLSQVAREDMTDADRDSLRSQAYYWMAILILLFVVLVVAISDYTATSLYGRQQLARIREEQRTLLERDLAVHRQQKLNDRIKGL